MKKFILLLFFFTQFAWSLEIDEKLTVRIVGTSESKKTALINRGIEDGIAVGDHAKFFVSVGVVARGVVIKASPTRSVWSLYRLVNKEYIREEQVLKLKITPAVKITKDESKMLVKDDSAKALIAKDPRDIGIPLADGADDLTRIEQGQGKVQDMAFDVGSVDLLNRNREIFGMLSYSSFTESTSPDNSSQTDYTQDVTNLYFKLGGEWYFKTEDKWYSNVSFLAHFALERKSTMAFQGATASEEGSEFGFGINLHPTKKPSRIHEIIPYLNYTLSLGSVNSTYSPGREWEAGSEQSVDASVFAHSVGFGGKYYTTQGIGARVELSYYLRGEAFAADPVQVIWTKTRVGPRILFGLSYRL